ncbi:hypothetical protein M8J77_000243 [Diaphorina citri]|nr:hypothetical protein M8J77_000243 [Diaphorina citri]
MYRICTTTDVHCWKTLSEDILHLSARALELVFIMVLLPSLSADARSFASNPGRRRQPKSNPSGPASDETSDETRRDRAPFQVETKFHKIHLSFRGHFSTRQGATRGKKRNFSSRNPPLEVFN